MSHQIKLNYRPEIDGLRAIAVISVIIYHIEFFISGKKILTGGFLGADKLSNEIVKIIKKINLNKN